MGPGMVSEGGVPSGCPTRALPMTWRVRRPARLVISPVLSLIFRPDQPICCECRRCIGKLSLRLGDACYVA